jgi:hypothetical protein
MPFLEPDWHFFCFIFLRSLFFWIFDRSIKATLIYPKHFSKEGVDYEKDGFGFRSLLALCFSNSIRGTRW